ncbi:FAD-binding oxidoreductase [Aquimarina sp. TRL1]|uniref:NAD(P)/FAD-dependent oxidoreductase n=1 Tax=Aquimarina sp. (strain TRL1) TaxID=2736252 RepID=UPI00158DC3A0|nr:FAD-dependent oxidoreductase [Aquimarina sp. TRL1]QKX06745.1 FAD-binding oxidoreductase [Aquimarina sp. TRL1]
MTKKERITICGAGIAGVATAYYLLQKSINLEVLLIDKQQPLSFTTSKSGENFRDYWPQECMRLLCNRSIALMESLLETHGEASFEMKKTGYQFVSHHRDAPIFDASGKNHAKNHVQLLTDQKEIKNRHSYLDSGIEKVVTIVNAGAIDVYAMGSLLIKEIKKKGGVFYSGEIQRIVKTRGTYDIHLDTNEVIATDKIIIAAGPFINHIAAMLGMSFPISNTMQHKFVIPDPYHCIPEDMPFTIYADAQHLSWTDEEKRFFSAEEQFKWLLQKFPGGLHIKPDGGGRIKMGWAFQTRKEHPHWTPQYTFSHFPNVVLKGASRFIPALSEYENQLPTPLTQYSGYYTRTEENWPLIGPTERTNVFVVGALAGFGTMTACGAGELCANHVLGETSLPVYSDYFHPSRYHNSSMIREMKLSMSDGQL